MKDFNGITRIGKATVLPGDIVYGAGGGVLFIPAHLVVEVVDGAAKTHVKDDFGFEMIAQNKFTTAQIDRATWTEEMLDMLKDIVSKLKMKLNKKLNNIVQKHVLIKLIMMQRKETIINNKKDVILHGL